MKTFYGAESYKVINYVLSFVQLRSLVRHFLLVTLTMETECQGNVFFLNLGTRPIFPK